MKTLAFLLFSVQPEAQMTTSIDSPKIKEKNTTVSMQRSYD